MHRATRAALQEQGIEAEIREILESIVKTQSRVKLGSLLAEIGRRVQLSHHEFAIFENLNDKKSARATNFE